MGIRKKFNWVLLTCLLPCFVAIYWFQNNTRNLNTEMNLLHKAEVVFQITESIRTYNQTEVSPIINQTNAGFMPQAVGSYAASQVMNEVQKTLPDLIYKVAIDQAEIARYQPNIWQQNIINQFKQDPSLPLISTKVVDAKGRFMVYAKPIIEDQKVQGAKIIRINDQHHFQQDNGFEIVLYLGLLGLIIVVLNLILNQWIFTPVLSLAKQADQISQGRSEQDEIDVAGSDEISHIATSFNRMQRSLKAAMGMLS